MEAYWWDFYVITLPSFVVSNFIIYTFKKQYGIICAVQILSHIEWLDKEKRDHEKNDTSPEF